MPSYLSLINFTDQGIKNVKGSPGRIDAAKEAIKTAGGRMIFYYMLMGEYDIATLVEFPDDATAAKFLMNLGAAGNIRSHTMRAFTEAESREMIESL